MRAGLNFGGDGSIVPAAARTDGTVTGNAVDVSGYEEVLIVIPTGTVTDGTHTFSLTESDAVGGTYTAVAAADVVVSSTGSGANIAVLNTTATHDNAVVIGMYKGKQPFIKVVCVSASCSTGAVFAACVVGTKARHQPVATPAA